MGTRSFICKSLPGEKLKIAYCHWNGGPEDNGATLVDYYSEEEKVDDLLALGDMSVLKPEIGEKHDFDSPNKKWTIFYGRDRGETGTEAIEIMEVELERKACNIGVDYIYIFRDGMWEGYKCNYIHKGIKFLTKFDLEGKLVSRYIYVLAYTSEGQTCFEHIFVEATSEDDAYSKGMMELDDKVIGPEVELLNNYVVKV